MKADAPALQPIEYIDEDWEVRGVFEETAAYRTLTWIWYCQHGKMRVAPSRYYSSYWT